MAKGSRRTPPTRAPRGYSKGFALLATIWTIGLLTLLGTAVVVSARYRASDISSSAATTRTALAAESAINLTIALLLQEPGAMSTAVAKFPLRCRLPEGESAIITLEDEDGKIDLNTANPQLLARLFSRLSGRADEGARVADRIVQFRQITKSAQPPSAPNRLPAPVARAGYATPIQTRPVSPIQPGPDRPVTNSGFVSIFQLDQIASLSPATFNDALPFLTVWSRRTEPSSAVAPERLRHLLDLPTSAPATPLQGGGSANYTIRADVSADNGSRFIREAVVTFTSGGRPFQIHEWLRGDIDPSREPAHVPAQLRSCLEYDYLASGP